jgi:hypothetical protein
MRILIATSFILALGSPALGDLSCPDGHDGALPVNNDQVLQWKNNSTDTVRARAHIQGQVIQRTLMRDRTQRIEVRIGPERDDVLEVFYRPSHPPHPNLKKGDTLEACGDLFADQRSKAIVTYWVHISKDEKHLPGYVVVKGKVYGGLRTAAR